eukprot:scaffold72143_cov75-Phaeocystis_antarctica.AAC.2
MPAAAAPSVGCGASFSPTADATAERHSPTRTARAPLCIATSADEHAVSMLKHGPCSPSTNDSRPPATDVVSPYSPVGALDP